MRRNTFKMILKWLNLRFMFCWISFLTIKEVITSPNSNNYLLFTFSKKLQISRTRCFVLYFALWYISKYYQKRKNLRFMKIYTTFKKMQLFEITFIRCMLKTRSYGLSYAQLFSMHFHSKKTLTFHAFHLHLQQLSEMLNMNNTW